MAGRAQPAENNSASKAMAIVQELLHDYHPRDFAIEFWDGSRLGAEPGQFCRFTWHIHRSSVFRSLLRSDRQVALGEAFIYGDFDISGDILAIFPVAQYLSGKHFSAAEKLRLGALLLGLPSRAHEGNGRAGLDGRPHSKSRDRSAIIYHYDVSNDFYRLWLDPELVYSCAYFKSPEDKIALAQQQK